MKKYLEQRNNLEKQGWKPYQMIGGMVYFSKKEISGLVVEVNNTNGKATLHSSAPDYFADKHKPNLLELN